MEVTPVPSMEAELITGRPPNDMSDQNSRLKRINYTLLNENYLRQNRYSTDSNVKFLSMFRLLPFKNKISGSSIVSLFLKYLHMADCWCFERKSENDVLMILASYDYFILFYESYAGILRQYSTTNHFHKTDWIWVVQYTNILSV